MTSTRVPGCTKPATDNHVVDTYGNGAHSGRDHRGQAGSGIHCRQLAGKNKFAFADRQNCAAAKDLRWHGERSGRDSRSAEW